MLWKHVRKKQIREALHCQPFWIQPDSDLLHTHKSHSHSSQVFSVKLFRIDIAVIWVSFLPCLVKHIFLPLTACVFPLSQHWCIACISQSVWKTAAIDVVRDDWTIPVNYCVVHLLYDSGSERMMKKLKTHYSLVCHQITEVRYRQREFLSFHVIYSSSVRLF